MTDNTGEFIALQTALAGRYSLERELGRGGMGVVYLARDVALDRPVALKLLPPRLATQPVLRERFLREARTAAKLSHPNIVPIFAVEETGDFVFFVMAFVEGETLGQRLRERGPVPPHELTTLLREVAWGLAYAHGQGIVHRDVKADNILLEQGSNRALVADFGIAGVTHASGTPGGNEVMGTAEYMSPEQAGGERVDQRSDIYSLGIVAFYALSGKLPFEGASLAEVLAKQIAKPAPPVAEAAPGVPSRLARAVDRCLSKEPAARFQQASDLADALALALEARREAPMALKVFMRKARELAGALGVVGLAQPILISVMVGLLTHAGHDADDAFAAFMLFLGDVMIALMPLGGLMREMRKLARAGYAREDVLLSWKSELEREAEERMFDVGRRSPRWERALRVIGATVLPPSLLVIVVTLFAPSALRHLTISGHAFLQLFFAGLVGVVVGSGATVLATFQHIRRTDLGGRLLGWLFKTDFAKSCFNIAKLGLRKVRLIAPATHRPTEMAIGMAVEALFEALPKAERRQLGDLPEVVRRLEDDATRMRERVAALNDVSHSAADDNLRTVRDQARQRLTDAVSALEAIRLNLLRLTAGAGSVESLTADLSAARDLSEQLGLLLEGQREVETLLRRRTPSGPITPPSISPVPGS